jgi:PAS domain S-box-containing protein
VDVDFKTLVESAPTSIGVLDRDRRCIYANPALERAFGHPTAELNGKRPEDLLGSVDARLRREAVENVFGTGAPDSIEFSIAAQQGSRRFATLLAVLPDQRVCD